MMRENSNNYGVVLVTAADKSTAEKIAKHLLEAKLAACVNILPITSIDLSGNKRK